jgi:3'-5' exonuclease
MTVETETEAIETLDDLFDDDVIDGSFSVSVVSDIEDAAELARQDIAKEQKPPTVCGGVRTGDCLYFDIETVPDFEREHLFGLEPVAEYVETRIVDLYSQDEFCSLDLKEATKYLASKTPPIEWVAACVEFEKESAKPRKGMLELLEKCDKAREDAKNAKADRIKLLSVTPMFCKIVCIGVASDGEPQTMTASNADEERKMLNWFWLLAEHSRPLTGFNCLAFDLQVILFRSMILGVPVPRLFSQAKYNNADVLDLMNVLYPNGCPKGFGLKPTCRMLGIDISFDFGDGSQVFQMWEAGQLSDIADYCARDVEITRQLHREKLAGYVCL